MKRDPVLLHKVCSILLQYPDRWVYERLDDVTAALPAFGDRRARESLAEFAGWLDRTGQAGAAEHYVATFDLRRRCCLYVSYYRHGDTRARGMALLGLKQTYREAGYQPPDDELPDYLPLMLEFAALAPERGRQLLVRCQAGLELLARGLDEAGSPYRHLVDAVRAGLPAPGRRQRAIIAKLFTEGPPAEQVGLEPFAPPEFAAGSAR